MISCTSCGADVTGKKFCPHCGTPVQATGAPATGNQAASSNVCPRCNGEVAPGAAYCMHCGSALSAQPQVAVAAVPPAMQTCPACQAQVPLSSAFCTNCGHDMRAAAVPRSAFCTSCGQQNAPGVRFCAHCGSPMGAGAAQPGQYQPQPQYPQQYPQQYMQQGSYQAQPMMGQGPMVLRCPTCMAMAPLGTPSCPSCRTSLAGIVPTPANVAAGQQSGLGGFLQGSGGQMAMGALGGAAAVIGGEMLLHGIENSIENRVEGDMGMGYGYPHHHHRHHREEGLLGELGDLANDVGL